MDWNTLISVMIGGLIATIGHIINNRFQAQERQKDREEQRRYTKIQVRETWTERDSLRIMELLESAMKLLKEEQQLDWAQVILEDKKEYMREGGTFMARIPERIQEYDNSLELMDRLIYSFHDDDMNSSIPRKAEDVIVKFNAPVYSVRGFQRNANRAACRLAWLRR